MPSQPQLTGGHNEKDLTPRLERFCAEYVIDWVGAYAAERAGVSKASAKVRACQWLKLPAVQAEIERLKSDTLERLGVTSFSILKETAAIAHANVLDYLPALGLENSDLKKLTRQQAAAIREVEIEEFEARPEPPKTTLEAQPQGGTLQRGSGSEAPKPKLKRRITLKLAPKTAALELLGKHMNLWGGDESNSPTQIINNQVNVTIRRVGA